jgi:hypothetical protein
MELVAIFIILLALSIAGAIIGSIISIIIFLSKKKDSSNNPINFKRRLLRALPVVIVLLFLLMISDGPVTAGCRKQYTGTLNWPFSSAYCNFKEALGIETPLSNDNWQYNGFFD